MRQRTSLASFLVLGCALAIGMIGAGCEQLQPKAKPKKPKPGYYLSLPFPDVRELNDVIALSPTLAYAVGTDGTILKGVGNLDKKGKHAPGFTWTRENSGVTDDLQAITGFLVDAGAETEREVLVAVGHNGVVLSRDSTTTPPSWNTLPSGTTKILFSVALRSESDGFISGEAGTILRYVGTPDGAGGITPSLVDQTPFTLQTAFGLDCPADLACGADANGVLNTCGVDPVDGVNKCKTQFPIPETLKGVGFSGNLVRVVGPRGTIYFFDADNTDPLQRWTREKSGTTRNLATIVTKDGTWMPATDGVLLVDNGGGPCADIDVNCEPTYSDEAFRTPAPVFLQDVWADQGNVFAVGFSQEIFHNDGAQWTLATVDEDAEMRGIDGYDAPPDDDPKGGAVATFIAVGGGGRIVRGPAVLPAKNEAALPTRIGDADFISP